MDDDSCNSGPASSSLAAPSRPSRPSPRTLKVLDFLGEDDYDMCFYEVLDIS